MQDARCRMQDVGCKTQDAGCKMQDARCKMQDVRCKMQDVRCKTQDARCTVDLEDGFLTSAQKMGLFLIGFNSEKRAMGPNHNRLFFPFLLFLSFFFSLSFSFSFSFSCSLLLPALSSPYCTAKKNEKINSPTLKKMESRIKVENFSKKE